MSLDIESLYREWAPMVYRRILRFYKGDEAEEVLHEVFVKVIENQEKFREDASVTTWLYQIATNHCLNRLRNAARREELWAEHSDGLFKTHHSPSQPESLLLKQIWELLDEDMVQLGIYYWVDGLTHAEIARIIGVSRRTVGNRLDELTALVRKAADITE